MPKSKDQNIISEIKRVEKSLKQELKKTLGLEFRRELKKTERNLRVEILRVEEKTEDLADGQNKLDVKLGRIENTLDGFVGTVDDLRKDNVVGAHHTREIDVKVDGHEKRITALESSAQ